MGKNPIIKLYILPLGMFLKHKKQKEESLNVLIFQASLDLKSANKFLMGWEKNLNAAKEGSSVKILA